VPNGVRRLSIYSSAILALGLVVGGWILGSEIRDVRMADRYVSVRGLAERTVKSDLAIWHLPFVETGDDLQTTFSKSQQDQATVLSFLAQQGIPKSDITLGQPSVIDRAANQFNGENKRANRFIVQRQVTVRSENIDQVAAALQKTSELVAHGIVLGTGVSYGPGNAGASYFFTGLNAIKPAMITEATRNARLAAQRFAADSKSKVGTIRQASQGLFTISDADFTGGAGGYSRPGSGIMKKVRVVTTVQYYLVK
jgi:uncharacterized protein